MRKDAQESGSSLRSWLFSDVPPTSFSFSLSGVLLKKEDKKKEREMGVLVFLKIGKH